MFDWLTGAGFEPHGECYLWTPGLIGLHVASDALITLAYYSIPLLLVYFIRRRSDIPFGAVFWMFGVFIIACGTTHLISIFEIWHGVYWLSGSVKAVTAAASVGTAMMLVPILPKALRLRSPAELDRINRSLSASLQEKDELLRLYQRERRVATVFQEASLPGSLPLVPGVEFDAVYLPGNDESEIGGDWYDAFTQRDGCVVLTIGDVVGHGLDAAVTMGKLRQTLRAFAIQADDPSAILTSTDAVFGLERPDSMATAIVAVFDPVRSTLAYSLAGHPPPLVRMPDGSVIELSGRPGLPLGSNSPHRRQTYTFDLPPGSVVVLYTDGLIETERDTSSSLAKLHAAMRRPEFRRDATHRPLAHQLAEAMLDGVAHQDDVAIVTMALHRERLQSLDIELPAVPSNARVARAAIVRMLEAHRCDPDFIFRATVVAGELVMNVIEHAYGTRSGTFRLRLQLLEGSRVQVTVCDDGRWRPRRNDGRGRGLLVIGEMTDAFEVSQGERGTCVTATLSPLDEETKG